MKTRILFTVLILSIALSAWTTDPKRDLNTNSWSIRVGKTVLLASWKNNTMGDAAVFDQTKFKATDTLFAEQFLCGFIGVPATTTLILKNQKNEIIKKTIKNGFSGYVPLSQLVALPDFKSEQTIGIYVTVDMEGDKHTSEPVLFGRLTIK